MPPNKEINRYIKPETVSQTPFDLLKDTIVLARNSIISCLETYDKSKQNKSYFFNIIKPKIKLLFNLIRSSYRYNTTTEEFENVLDILNGEDKESIIETFFKIDDWLYTKRLLRWDSSRTYDDNNPIAEDLEKGL